MPKRPALFEAIKDLLKPTVKAVLEQLHPAAQSGPVVRDLCELVDVIEFSVKLRAENPEVTSILLRKERREERWLVTHVLLDEHDNLIRKEKGLLGRTLSVKSLDDELRDLFGEAESAVIELPPKGDQKRANSDAPPTPGETA